MNQFQQVILAEGVRYIEGDLPSLAVDLKSETSLSFEQLVFLRAKQLDLRFQISPLFIHFKRIFLNFSFFLFFILFILGAGSVDKLFFSMQGTQVNVFWAFALFFIPNLMTLILWFFLFIKGNSLNTTWLQRFSLFLIKSFEKRFNQKSSQKQHYWSLFRCYFNITFSQGLGRYQLSALTHLLWFGYFCGATLFLIIMLATHQVDFIWQTSILSDESFQLLTKTLAYLPKLIGFPVPNFEQIQQSHLGTVHLLDDAENTRFVWSSLLISSLIFYGLVPRLLLLLLMRILLNREEKTFFLTLTSQYYVQLRLLLKPNVTSLGIVDPDKQTAKPYQSFFLAKHKNKLPEQFYPLAFELSKKQLIQAKEHVKQYACDYYTCFQNILDYKSQQKTLAFIGNLSENSVVLYISLQHTPDRGSLNFIKGLRSQADKCYYLLLIDDPLSDFEQITNRLSDWYALAKQADISLDNVIQLKISDKNGDANEK